MHNKHDQIPDAICKVFSKLPIPREIWISDNHLFSVLEQFYQAGKTRRKRNSQANVEYDHKG